MWFAVSHMPMRPKARILRRFAKHSDHQLRKKALAIIKKKRLHEVALPAEKDGEWDPAGWHHGSLTGELNRHQQNAGVLARNNLLPVETIADLREGLKIKSPQQLGYLYLATHENNGPYTTFTIPKRDGSKRLICAPRPQLMWVQRRILNKILARTPVHDCAHGFVTGRSTVTNATPHCGAEVIVKFDLEDFFPSIHFYRIAGLFASLGYQVDGSFFSNVDTSRRIATSLARLCVYAPHNCVWGGGFAPQGAPTSPAISNLVCRGMDARLNGLAQKNNAAYTRYADDLTFSFKQQAPDIGRFRWWVNQICHQEGFIVNESKFRVIRRSQRQMVTGIVVNDQPRIPRTARRRFRAILHNCRKHGVASQANGNPAFTSYLSGFASYVYMVHPEEGAELLRQVNELTGKEGKPHE